MNTDRQRRLPFEPSKEQARRARVERLLSGELRKHVKPASELRFNYQAATRLARKKQKDQLNLPARL